MACSDRCRFAIADRFPVSPGHRLVVPRRAIANWWEATDGARADILTLVDEVKHQLDAELQPDGIHSGVSYPRCVVAVSAGRGGSRCGQRCTASASAPAVWPPCLCWRSSATGGLWPSGAEVSKPSGT
jgi:HIT domain